MYIYTHIHHTHLYFLIFFCIQFFCKSICSNHTEYIQILETVIIHSLGFSAYPILFPVITLKIIYLPIFTQKLYKVFHLPGKYPQLPWFPTLIAFSINNYYIFHTNLEYIFFFPAAYAIEIKVFLSVFCILQFSSF